MTRVRLLIARDVAVAAVAALLALPAAAPATTVEATDDTCASGPPECITDLEIKGGPGERNDLSVVPDGQGVVVSDAAAPLTPGRNCVRRDERSVRCELSRPIAQVEIETGEADDVVRALLPGARLVTVILSGGDDRFEGAAQEVWANGLDGDDVLVAVGGRGSLEGRKGADVLVGSPVGDEELSGGPGRDRVAGGAGDDVILGGDGDFEGDVDDVPAADELDGGPGRDTLSYAPRDLPVTVDLADPAPDGARGEGDVVRGFENVRGGRGGDRLSGDAGPNRLLGGDGDDTLRGRGGDDLLALERTALAPRRVERADGGPGDDDVRGGYGGVVAGGSGDDILRGSRDTAAVCGSGVDTVRPRPGQSMRMASDCERWRLPFGSADPGDDALPTRPHMAGGSVALSLGCPRSARACTLTMTVATRGRRRLGRDVARARPGQHPALSVRVPPGAARRALRVFVQVRDADGYGVGGGVLVTPR